MANSSKEYDCTNRKVIVVKKNELLALKQQKERLEELKKNLTDNSVTFTSKVSGTADSSTPGCSYYTEGSVRHPRSLIKLSKYNCATPSSHKPESAPIKKYKRKVSVIENGLERTKFVDFADLSRATISSTTEINETTTTKKDVENETINSDNITEERVMELIDKKYGAALEAQLNLFDDIKVGECATELQVETPSTTLQEYSVREEEFLNETDKEQEGVKEAQKHLETILILDSPDDGYTLFSREELKKLPEKIFESPVKSIVKEEIIPEVKSSDHFEKSNSNVEDGAKAFNVTEEKKEWVYDPNDIDIILSDLKNLSTEDPKKPEENIKKITIANEDAAIFKEIDEFIEEISVKDKSQLSKEACSVTKERIDALDHDYCLENIEIGKNCGVIDDADVNNEEDTKKIADECSPSTNICVDAARFEDAIKCIIYKNDMLEQERSEENTSENQTEPEKSDILARLIQASEIPLDQTATDNINYENPSDNCSKSVVDVLEEPIQVNTITNDQNGFDNFSVQFKSDEQLETTESAIMIIKENGFLEPVDLDTNGSDHGENKEQTHCNKTEATPDAGKLFSPEELRKTSNRIDRKEILALLEKARAVQYDKNDNIDNSGRGDKTNLKHFAISLKGQVGFLKKLYERLGLDSKLVEEELDGNMTDEELLNIQDDLNFIKTIIDKSFIKQEKKLKYKVISIKRKSTDHRKQVSPVNKPVTKKVYHKISFPRCSGTVSNKLLRKTLFRMDRLLGIIERNQKLLTATKQKAFGSKLNRKGGQLSDTSDSEEEVVKERSEGDVTESSCSQNKSFTQVSLENNNEKSQHSIKSKQSLKLSTDGGSLQEKEIELTPRYPLRSRQKTNTSLTVHRIKDQDKNTVDSALPYDVNYSNVLPVNKKGDLKINYVLKNDNKPCVVLYRNKDKPKESIFEKSNVCLTKKNLVVELTQENKTKNNKYETRSKKEKIKEDTQRVLRSRKL